MTTGNQGLDALAQSIADYVVERLNATSRRMLSVKEAAEYMGFSRRKVEYMLQDGTLTRVREGSTVRLDRREIDRWIEMNRTKG